MDYQEINVSDGSHVGDPAPLPAELVGLADESLADLDQALDPTPEQFVGKGYLPIEPAPPPPPSVILSSYEFLLLFTSAERIAILTAGQASMAIADWLNMLNHVPAVHLDDANTIAGVEALQTAGLIAGGRAAQILANQAP